MRRLLIAFALLSSPAFGQLPQPPPPKPQPVASVKLPAGVLYAGKMITLDGSASIGDSLDWEVISPPDFAGFEVDSNGKKLFMSDPAPGTFVFRMDALSVIDGKIAKSKQRVAFTTIPVKPAPDPIPILPPGPPDPPTPTPGFAGHVHATLVFDVDEPSTAQVRASTVKADLKALDADWYVAPSVGPVAKLFSKYTTSDGLPTVYFTDDAGKMVGPPLKAPTAKDQVIAALKAIRGVK